ncbi:MAG: thioredoxin family protein [Armatimonadota bacterium]|nr:thioredoxin family protein [Armatimonadota bacterium]MDW8156586.1 thioredoxin family protein [Armatimonadota bacterium]
MDRLWVVLAVAAALALAAGWVRCRDRRLARRLRLPPGPAVVAFTHRLCAPCRTQQLPALQRLQRVTGTRVRVQVVDVGRHPEVARRFGIFTVPSSVVVGPDGRVVAFNHGFADDGKLLRQLGWNGSHQPARRPAEASHIT